MAMTELALEVEDSEEGETFKLKPTMSAEWPQKKEILHAYRSFMPSWWRSIFTMSCLLSVSVDPLFLYIPITNEDMKCLRLDQNLKTVTLLLRSAVDLPCLVDIISQILPARPQRWSQVLDARPGPQRWSRLVHARPGPRRRVTLVEHALEMAKRISWSYFLIDILAILPIPQVVILILLPRTRGSKSLSARKFLNSLIVFQYFPRLFRMYQSRKVNQEEADSKARYRDSGHRIWLRVYKFILASHVLGAFWYFFSIQREIDCWQYACRRENKYEANTLECGGNHTFKNVTFLNDLCPISTPNPTLFNFGIFLDALQSGILESTDFPQKFLHCFLWGLRSLSSFGQNLQTSTYAWENLFVLGITVAGLILFLIYLSAILQLYMAKATTRAEEVREKIQIEKNDIEEWMEKNGLQDDMKEEIMKNIKQKLEEYINADLENLFSVLPWYTKKALKRVLCMSALRKVPMLSKMDEKVLKLMCDYLKPVNYPENTLVFQMGEPLDRMVFITEGFMWTYTSATDSSHYRKATEPATSPSMDTNFLKKGDSYGHALLQFASSSLTALPTSDANVRCHTKVEAFVLMAEDLKNIVTKCVNLWPFDYNASKDEKADQVVLLEQFQQQKDPKKRLRRYQGRVKALREEEPVRIFRMPYYDYSLDEDDVCQDGDGDADEEQGGENC